MGKVGQCLEGQIGEGGAHQSFRGGGRSSGEVKRSCQVREEGTVGSTPKLKGEKVKRSGNTVKGQVRSGWSRGEEEEGQETPKLGTNLQRSNRVWKGRERSRGRATKVRDYRMRHLTLRRCGSGGSRAAKIASSNTFLRPFCVRAEHSTYLTDFNSRLNLSPCSEEMGFCLFLASFSTVAASSLRSICVPTSRNGVFWQWCVISGTH